MSKQLLENKKANCMELVESWSDVSYDELPNALEEGERVNFMEGIENPDKQMLVAQLLENSRRLLNNMSETTKLSQVGEFEKFIFPVIRAAYANSILPELVSVQPMTSRVGQVFYMDAIYDSSKGSVSRGDKLSSATGGPNSADAYPSEHVDGETVSAGGSAAVSGTLSWTPVRPGTVVFTDGDQEVTDDGNGSLQGDAYSGGTINYVTGAFSFTYHDAPAAGTATSADYEWDSECQTPPKVSIQMTSSPVVARPYKLAADWCIEADQELRSVHGMNLEDTVVSFASNEIQKALMYSCINQLLTVANAGNVVYDINPPTGVQEFYHRQSFINSLITASGNIYQATQRDQASWMVCGIGIANILQGLTGVGLFKPAATNDKTVGAKYIGDAAGLKVYVMPAMNTNTGLLGYKGTDVTDAGFIYAPYLGLFTTPTIMLEDMKARKGMKMSAAKKICDAGKYSTITVINSAS